MKRLLLLIVLLITFGVTSAQDDESPVWPERVYAPYVYGASAYPIAYLAEQAGLRYLTLSFVLAGRDSCQAAWDGASPLSLKKQLAADIEKLREAGGDVIIAFGGASGQELAQVCTDVESLTAQYQAVIDAYDVTTLDFDIEGHEITETESVERRSQAIAALQANAAEAGKPLRVMFTLPVMPTGLTEDGLSLLQSAIDNGVDIAVVNIMTMNYGADYPPDEMGARSVQAAESLYAQLAELYPDKSEAELWAMIGLTPMIGRNDSVPSVFTLDDAALLVDFAREKGIGHLAMWALGRDRTCPGGSAMVSGTCSGIDQDDGAFSAVFKTFMDDSAS